MSKLKAIILKGIINEKFEEIFYNKQETDISELKFVISKIIKKMEQLKIMIIFVIIEHFYQMKIKLNLFFILYIVINLI
jgi:hypothetical protein